VPSKSSVLSNLARLAPAAIFVLLSRSLRQVCKTWLYIHKMGVTKCARGTLLA